MEPYLVCTGTPPGLRNKIQIECTGLTGSDTFSELANYRFNNKNYAVLGRNSIPLDGTIDMLNSVEDVDIYSTAVSGKNGEFEKSINIKYTIPYFNIEAPNVHVTFDTPVQNVMITLYKLENDEEVEITSAGENIPDGISSMAPLGEFGEFNQVSVTIFSMPNAGERFRPGNIHFDIADVITADTMTKCELTERIDLSLQEQPFNELNIEFDNTDRREMFDYEYYYLVDKNVNYGCFNLFEKNNMSSDTCSLKLYDITNKFIKESGIEFIDDVDIAMWLTEEHSLQSIANLIIEDSISTEKANTTIEVTTSNFAETGVANVGTARPETSLLMLALLQNHAVINSDRNGRINIIKEPSNVTEVKKHIPLENILDSGFKIEEEFYSGVTLTTNFVRYFSEENKALERENVTFSDNNDRTVVATEVTSSGFTESYFMTCYYNSGKVTNHSADIVAKGVGYAIFAPYKHDVTYGTSFTEGYYYVPSVDFNVSTISYTIKKQRAVFKNFDTDKEISCGFISDRSALLKESEETQNSQFEYSADDYIDYLYNLYIGDKDTTRIANFSMFGDNDVMVGDNITFDTKTNETVTGTVTSLITDLKSQSNVESVEVFCK